MNTKKANYQVPLPLILMGLPGSGKSTVGVILGERLGLEVLDTDEMICKAAQISIPQIFSQQGEKAFRELEYTQVSEALSRDSVVCLGGGAPTYPATNAVLQGHHVWYLKVDPGEAASRVGSQSGRPLLDGAHNPIQKLTALLNARQQIYEALARHTIDVTNLDASTVASIILEAYEGGKYE